jgi:hypothetical protein
MSAADLDKAAKVKLITLLNVASARQATKRKTGEDWHEIARRAKKSKVPEEAGTAEGKLHNSQQASGPVEVEEQVDDDDEEAEQPEKLAGAENDDEDENGGSAYRRDRGNQYMQDNTD